MDQTTELHRIITERPVELRAAPEGTSGPGMLVGYALTYGALSRDLGGWFEIIEPGAFDQFLAGTGRVMCRAEHDSRLLLGTNNAGTLRLFSDEIGVRYEVDLPNTGAGRDAAALAARGDYQFSSFAFHDQTADGWEVRDDGTWIWHVRSGALVDVAPVADPAYWGSSVAKRDVEGARAALAERTAGEPPAQDSEVAGLALRDATAARLRLLGIREGE